MDSLIRKNRGQAIVEFALVINLLLLILFGITEFGRAWMTVNVLTSAAREGVRLAVVTEPNVIDVKQRVTDVCTAAGITPTAITVVGPNPQDIERKVTVTVKANFKILTGDILGPMSGTIPLSAESVMRYE